MKDFGGSNNLNPYLKKEFRDVTCYYGAEYHQDSIDYSGHKALKSKSFLIMYATIFLILMSLGIALTRLKVFSFKKSLISSLARVIIGPLIGFYIIYYFNLSGFAAGVLLIQCSMPSAVLNFLVGSLYSPKKTVDDVASMIFVSTVLSFITIPVVVFIALKYFS